MTNGYDQVPMLPEHVTLIPGRVSLMYGIWITPLHCYMSYITFLFVFPYAEIKRLNAL